MGFDTDFHSTFSRREIRAPGTGGPGPEPLYADEGRLKIDFSPVSQASPRHRCIHGSGEQIRGKLSQLGRIREGERRNQLPFGCALMKLWKAA